MQKWIKAVYEDLSCFIRLFHITHLKFNSLKKNLYLHSARRTAKIKGTYKTKLNEIENGYCDIITKYKKEILLENYKTEINLLKSNAENKCVETEKLKADWEKMRTTLQGKMDYTERDIETKMLQLSHMKITNDEWEHKVMMLEKNELVLQSKLTEMKNETEKLQKACLHEASLRAEVESELEKCLRENNVLKNEKEEILQTVSELQKKICESRWKSNEAEKFVLCYSQPEVVPQFDCTLIFVSLDK